MCRFRLVKPNDVLYRLMAAANEQEMGRTIDESRICWAMPFKSSKHGSQPRIGFDPTVGFHRESGVRRVVRLGEIHLSTKRFDAVGRFAEIPLSVWGMRARAYSSPRFAVAQSHRKSGRMPRLQNALSRKPESAINCRLSG